MSGRRIETPTLPQRIAADPGHSAWVTANAGSGKTRVLTHRVARLLLDGAPPGKILCLTYTRAAAAEMQNRLFQMLGRWAMDDDETLASELAALSGSAPPDRETLRRARRLFARALETPGGLKIQTIHAFCDALLRRFPLEAGVSPGFEVLDDRQSTEMIAAIREYMARQAEEGRSVAFDHLADRLADTTLDDTIRAIRNARGDLDWVLAEPGPEPRIAAHFGPAAHGPGEAAASALAKVDWRTLEYHAGVLEAHGGTADGKAAKSIRTAIGLRSAAPPEAAMTLAMAFLRQDGLPRSRKGFPVKAVLKAAPEADAFTDAMIDWAMEARDGLKAAEVAARTRDLHLFAEPMLRLYEAAKAAHAVLDYDDLIDRSRALLQSSDMAAWVLYRLDLGIDHVLVDEAQDTSPAQWEVIDAIVSEFQSGEGARDLERTLFVVGDEKQSIYSFQGARPRAFAEMRARNAERLSGLGKALAQPGLETSFRSAPAILRFVDGMFEGEAARGLTSEDVAPRHEAHRADAVGRVDLWPLVEPPEAEPDLPWDAPVDTPPPTGAKAVLALSVAREIRRMIDETTLPGPGGRPVRPGDILVLVSRRDSLARGILRNLKGLGVPVAGADRMQLTEEIAVKDLLALLQVSVTPGDDLSLAALLRSPLCGLSEEELFDLAHDRPGRLISEVLERGPAPVAEMLRDMARAADFRRPYELLERALIVHDGRRKLLSRLGQEAEDPIDELLAQALAYERKAAPTVTGFLDWIAADDAPVKREMEAGRDEVRLMTVHGAKGLEAPIVILPDTMSKGRADSTRFLRLEGGNAPPLTIWPAGKTEDDRATAAAREESDRLAAEERRRLLYVAATRAEDWLILCGAGDPTRSEGTWYALVDAAMRSLDCTSLPTPAGEGLRLEDPFTGLHASAPAASLPATEPRPPRPNWLCPAEPERAQERRAPSRLVEGGEEPHGGEGIGREAALRHGNAVHLILERLAGECPLDEALAHTLLAATDPDLSPEAIEAAIKEAQAVLAAPFAPEVFGTNSLPEVAIALDAPRGGPRMIGRIDRLVLGTERNLVIDYKTDAFPPESPEGIPRQYLAQMAAYVAGIAALYPDRPAEGAFLWTRTRQLMPVPQGSFSLHAEDVTLP